MISVQEMLDVACGYDTPMAQAMARACVQHAIITLEPLRYPDKPVPAPRYAWDPIEVRVSDEEYERILSISDAKRV